MTDALTRICADKRRHISDCKARRPMGVMVDEVARAPPPRGSPMRWCAPVQWAATG